MTELDPESFYGLTYGMDYFLMWEEEHCPHTDTACDCAMPWDEPQEPKPCPN